MPKNQIRLHQLRTKNNNRIVLAEHTQQPFYGPLSRTTRVSRYQKKHSPNHHPDHHPVFISLFHLPRSIASSLLKLHAWQSFCITSFHVLFGLPLGLQPSTSYSILFFTQSVSSFRSTCPYHRNLFCCSISVISSIPSLSLNSWTMEGYETECTSNVRAQQVLLCWGSIETCSVTAIDYSQTRLCPCVMANLMTAYIWFRLTYKCYKLSSI